MGKLLKTVNVKNPRFHESFRTVYYSKYLSAQTLLNKPFCVP